MSIDHCKHASSDCTFELCRGICPCLVLLLTPAYAMGRWCHGIITSQDTKAYYVVMERAGGLGGVLAVANLGFS